MFHQPEGLELQQPRATPWVPSGLRLQIKDVSSARRAGAATAQGNALGAFGPKIANKRCFISPKGWSCNSPGQRPGCLRPKIANKRCFISPKGWSCNSPGQRPGEVVGA